MIKGNKTVKLLGIKIDNKLDFNEHISSIYKKASLKLHAISPYINREKLRIIMKIFINAQFNYCLLIWMFHSRSLSNKINKLHEHTTISIRRLQLLNIDNIFTIHK